MKNKKFLAIFGLVGLVTAGNASAMTAAEAEQDLKKQLPQLTVSAIAESPVKGLYEVQAGENIIYYDAEGKHLLFAEIYTTTGKNLTADRRTEIAGQVLKKLPLDKAVKIGNGKNIVVEFTDPDCPYCRKGSQYFEKKTNVTRYVFFQPLDIHPEALSHVEYVLSAKDQGSAYEEAMGGKLDGKADLKRTDAGKALAKEHRIVAEKMGVKGTPMYYVNGTPVMGMNIPQLDELLKN